MLGTLSHSTTHLVTGTAFVTAISKETRINPLTTTRWSYVSASADIKDESPILTFDFDDIRPRPTDGPRVIKALNPEDVVDEMMNNSVLDSIQSDLKEQLLETMSFDLTKPTPFTEEQLDAIVYGKPRAAKPPPTATKKPEGVDGVPVRRRHYRRRVKN